MRASRGAQSRVRDQHSTQIARPGLSSPSGLRRHDHTLLLEWIAGLFDAQAREDPQSNDGRGRGSSSFKREGPVDGVRRQVPL